MRKADEAGAACKRAEEEERMRKDTEEAAQRVWAHTHMHACKHAYVHSFVHSYTDTRIHTLHTYITCIHNDTCRCMYVIAERRAYRHTYTHAHKTHAHKHVHIHISSLTPDGGGGGDEEQNRRGGRCLQTGGGEAGALEEGGDSLQGMHCKHACTQAYDAYMHAYDAYMHAYMNICMHGNIHAHICSHALIYARLPA